MAISALTAILIASGAGNAALQFFTGRSQGKAAEKASEQQQEGVREARAYGEPLYQEAHRIAREQYEQGQRIAAEQVAQGQAIAAQQHAAGQAGLAPYAQAGGASLTALQKFLGVPSAPAARPSAPMATAPMAVPPGGSLYAGGLPASPAAAAAPAGAVPLTSLVNGRGVPTSLLASLTTKEIADANRATSGAFLGGRGPATTSSYAAAAPAATQSAYVTLRAPTGEERPVPADQVAFYLARGATRI